MASVHTFFCIEDNCSAPAHVSGGRCDECFEAYIGHLRQEHNPLRCEWCHECSDLLLSESGRFCGRWCEAGWLNEHDCKGFHYDEVLEAYTCSECRSCYPEIKEHTCSGEFDCESGTYVCDDSDDPRCPQNRFSTRERILLEIRNTETMLGWGNDYDRESLEQSLVRLREQLSQLVPVCSRAECPTPQAAAARPVCESCAKDYSVALAAHPTVCPRCAFERLHPCEGLNQRRTETEPTLHC